MRCDRNFFPNLWLTMLGDETVVLFSRSSECDGWSVDACGLSGQAGRDCSQTLPTSGLADPDFKHGGASFLLSNADQLCEGAGICTH